MDVYIKGFLIACQGIPTTVWVSLIAIVIGAAFGLLLALCSQTKSKILQVLAKIYVDVVRGTPMLVQALIMAYGVPWLLQSWGTGFKWANLVIPAIIVCGCNSAAYMSEIIRSGIQAVDKGQMEAARSLGLSYGTSMRRVILPQAFKVMIPSIINQFIITLKDTSILSVIGYPELTNTGRTIAGNTFRSLETWAIVGLLYMIVIVSLSRAAKVLERRIKIGDK